MEKPYKFRRVNELTGLFVLGVLALVVAGVLFSGQSQRWFSRKFVLDVPLLPETGTFGLSRGNEVFILGVSAGTVEDIHVGEMGQMKAHVKIRADFERFVRVDSVASVKKIFGVAGDSYMEISRGKGEALPDRGAEIFCQSSEELPGLMEKMLTDLRAEVMPVVKKTGAAFDEWAKLGRDLRKTQDELRQLFVRLDGLAEGIEQGKGTVGELLTDTALVDDLRKLLTLANQSMEELQGVVTNAQAVVKNVQQGTARLPEITGTVANEVKDLPGLVIQTQRTLHELERLVEGLQRHWLVRKHMEPESASGGRISPVQVPGGKP